jgi:predicted enzyme related to lactoylglutathione lyase
MSGRPIWYELMTPDPGAVAPFYRSTLGWEIPAEGHAMPNGAEYREIKRGDGGFAGGVLSLTPAMTAGGALPGWMTYFHVDDVDVAVERATGLGASVQMPRCRWTASAAWR